MGLMSETEMQTAEPLIPGSRHFRSWFCYWKILKGINHRVFIKFWKDWPKQKAEHYVLRSTNLFILFGIRKNCHSCGKNLSFYSFMKGVYLPICA